MKLSHPVAIKSAALLASAVVRVWFSTLTTQVSFDDPACRPEESDPPKLYLFWHEMMLLPAYLFARTRTSVLISQHRDGELIAQVIRMMRGHATRGSTNRDGMTALRQLMRRGEVSHLAITPDGPRGPRRHVHLGSIYLASRGGFHIVPCGFAFGDNWRIKSWDRMALPVPGENARVVLGRPIAVPPDVRRDDMECYRLRVQQAMDDCQRRAQALACRASGTDAARVAAAHLKLRSDV
jgi:lysophospholipid acyltransferase (LPLAT)-like uncharacterized protein